MADCPIAHLRYVCREKDKTAYSEYLEFCSCHFVPRSIGRIISHQFDRRFRGSKTWSVYFYRARDGVRWLIYCLLLCKSSNERMIKVLADPIIHLLCDFTNNHGNLSLPQSGTVRTVPLWSQVSLFSDHVLSNYPLASHAFVIGCSHLIFISTLGAVVICPKLTRPPVPRPRNHLQSKRMPWINWHDHRSLCTVRNSDWISTGNASALWNI